MSSNEYELVQTGLRQLKEQDFGAAEATLRRAADAGDPEACRILAGEYRHGFHFSGDDPELEFRYMELAAEKGSLIDRCFMALYTASGLDHRIKKDRIRAAAWLEPVKAHPAALAISRLFGLSGCEPDKGAAVEFFRGTAEEQYGQPDEADWLSMFALAMAVISPGISLDQEAELGYLIHYAVTAGFRLSELNSRGGYTIMGMMLTANDGNDFDPEQEKEIVEQLERGAAGNDYGCMYYLGLYLLKHGQAERGRELIRKAAGHDTDGAVCKAALLDQEEGADPEQVLQKLEKSIEMGDDDALIPAATLLESRDEAKALEYIRKAANGGNAEGMVKLGNAYMIGWVVKKDPERAVQCYRDAAAEDCAGGHFNLGMALVHGEGVAADPYAAFGHVSYAAESSDDPQIWMELGRMLIEGIGCVPDREKGMNFLRRAADRDYGPAIFMWADYCINDSGKDLEELRRDVLPMVKKAADMGVTPAQTFYGMMLLNGIESDPDPGKAAEYFRQASKAGSSEADYWLGFIPLHGLGGKLDEQEAETYFTAAVQKGRHPKAMYELGKMALREKDYISAFQLFSEASGLKCGEATSELAAMYEKGLGMPKDPERADQLKELAREQKEEED